MNNKKFIPLSLISICIIWMVILVLTRNSPPSFLEISPFDTGDMYISDKTRSRIQEAGLEVSRYSLEEDKNISSDFKDIRGDIIWVDSDYFSIHQLPLLSGQLPGITPQLYLNQSLARDLFGSTALGEEYIEIMAVDYKISGVVEDGKKEGAAYISNQFRENLKLHSLMVAGDMEINKMKTILAGLNIKTDLYIFTEPYFLYRTYYLYGYIISFLGVLYYLIVSIIYLSGKITNSLEKYQQTIGDYYKMDWLRENGKQVFMVLMELFLIIVIFTGFLLIISQLTLFVMEFSDIWKNMSGQGSSNGYRWFGMMAMMGVMLFLLGREGKFLYKKGVYNGLFRNESYRKNISQRLSSH